MNTRLLAPLLLSILASACGDATTAATLDASDDVGGEDAATVPDAVAPDATRPDAGPPLPPAQAWFVPNVGSLDKVTLFTQPTRWANARPRIAAFGFYLQELLAQSAPDCPSCGPNILPAYVAANAFAQLATWKIDVSIEGGAVKEWDCTGDVTAASAIAGIGNVIANKGTVRWFSMDEPYIGGMLNINGKTCGLKRAQSAAVTAHFIEVVHATYPKVEIGDIEPYPYFKESELEGWIDELKTAGVTLPFFHLDVDVNHVKNIKADVAGDLAKLRVFLEGRGIPFGVIFTANEVGMPSSPALRDQFFYDRVMAWAQTVHAAIGRPEHAIFQSWFHTTEGNQVPINMPDDDPKIASHTRLLRDGLTLLNQ